MPELFGLGEFFVFCPEGKLGPEQKVLEGVLVKDAVNLHMVIKDLDLANKPVVVELDGHALTRQELDSSTITQGSRVEIVVLSAGG